MSNTILQVCNKPSSGNNFVDILRAKCGISTDGKHILNNLTNFTPVNITLGAGFIGTADSTGSKVKHVGDLVHLVFNITLTFTGESEDPPVPLTDCFDQCVLFEGIPLASPVSKYVNGFVARESNGNPFFLGKAEVRGTQLRLSAPATVPEPSSNVFLLTGEIFYKKDLEHKCVPCECFIKKNVYYTTKGIQLGKTLLTRFSTWKPLELELNLGTETTLVSQASFSRVFGDMVHISFSITFEYVEAPANDLVILETLPYTPALNTTYSNVGVDNDNPNTIIFIDNDTQLKVDRGGGAQPLNTPITISGQIVYNALLY